MSVDEPDGGGRDTSCEGGSTPTLTTVVTPAMLAPDERPLVEFDSPDSGLPSSRNYSVASGHSQIMSSIDDGQSMEEDTTPTGILEEHGGRDSLSEDKLCSQLDKLTTTTEATAPSFSSYAVHWCAVQRDSSPKNENYVINYSPSCHSKPIKNHIIFHILYIIVAPLCSAFLKGLDFLQSASFWEARRALIGQHPVHWDWPNTSSVWLKFYAPYRFVMPCPGTTTQKQ